MLTWHVASDGMKIYRDGKLIAHVHPDHYHKIVADMAREISHRWDGVRRDNER